MIGNLIVHLGMNAGELVEGVGLVGETLAGAETAVGRLADSFHGLGDAAGESVGFVANHLGLITTGLGFIPGPVGAAARSFGLLRLAMKGVEVVAHAFKGGALVGGLIGGISAVAGTKAIDGFNKLAKESKVSASAVSILDHIAKATQSDVKALAKALGSLAEELGDAESEATFAALGLNRSKLAAMDQLTALGLVADALKKESDATARAKAETALFGEQSKDLSTVLSGGSAAIQQMASDARELGIAVSDGAAKAVERATTAVGRVGLLARGFGQQIAAAFAPATAAAAEELVSVGQAFLPITESVFDFLGSLQMLGVQIVRIFTPIVKVLAGVLSTVLRPFLGAASAVVDAFTWVATKIADAFNWVIEAVRGAMAWVLKAIAAVMDAIPGGEALDVLGLGSRALWSAADFLTTEGAVGESAFTPGEKPEKKKEGKDKGLQFAGALLADSVDARSALLRFNGASAGADSAAKTARESLSVERQMHSALIQIERTLARGPGAVAAVGL